MPVVDEFLVPLEVPVVDFDYDSLVSGDAYYHAPCATVDNDGNYECDTRQLTFVGVFINTKNAKT
jgi:hypothetical protein